MTSRSSVTQTELADALRDRLRIDRRQCVEREERVVRARQGTSSRRDEAVPGAHGDRVTISTAAGATLPADRPGEQLGRIALADALAGARQLGPGMRLVPVHPPAAQLDVVAAPVAVPRAAAEAVARLDQRAVQTGDGQLARGRDAGEAPADDDGIEHARSLADP